MGARFQSGLELSLGTSWLGPVQQLQDVIRQSLNGWIVWPGWSGLVSEIVDLLLDGLVCEQCGIHLAEAVGYPRKCRTCEGLTDGDNGAGEEEVERGFPFDQRSIRRPQALPGQ